MFGGRGGRRRRYRLKTKKRSGDRGSGRCSDIEASEKDESDKKRGGGLKGRTEVGQ